MYKWKTDIQWLSDEIVSYRNRERYEFDKFSSGSLSHDDELVILNPLWNVSKKQYNIFNCKHCSM